MFVSVVSIYLCCDLPNNSSTDPKPALLFLSIYLFFFLVLHFRHFFSLALALVSSSSHCDAAIPRIAFLALGLFY